MILKDFDPNDPSAGESDERPGYCESDHRPGATISGLGAGGLYSKDISATCIWIKC